MTKRVKAIKELAHDDEAAHAAEDALYCDVLKAIANNTCEDPQSCAKEALRTNQINFDRWMG